MAFDVVIEFHWITILYKPFILFTQIYANFMSAFYDPKMRHSYYELLFSHRVFLQPQNDKEFCETQFMWVFWPVSDSTQKQQSV